MRSTTGRLVCDAVVVADMMCARGAVGPMMYWTARRFVVLIGGSPVARCLPTDVQTGLLRAMLMTG